MSIWFILEQSFTLFYVNIDRLSEMLGGMVKKTVASTVPQGID